MIAELGLAALWLATALAGLQLVAGFLGLRENGAGLAALVCLLFWHALQWQRRRR